MGEITKNDKIAKNHSYDFFLVKEICFRILYNKVSDGRILCQRFDLFEKNYMYVNYPHGGLHTDLMKHSYPFMKVFSIDVWPEKFGSSRVDINCALGESATKYANFTFEQRFFDELVSVYINRDSLRLGSSDMFSRLLRITDESQ